MNRFFQDRCAEPGFDHIGKHKVHSAPEKFFQEDFEIHISVERLPVELDHEIEVAGLGGLPPGVRAEEAQLPDTETPNFISVLLENFKDFISTFFHFSSELVPPLRQAEDLKDWRFQED